MVQVDDWPRSLSCEKTRRELYEVRVEVLAEDEVKIKSPLEVAM